MIFIPDFVGKTSAARKVLPEKYSIQDAVHNIGRVAWLVNALNTNSLHNLRFGVRDRLHQPQRGEHVYKHVSPRGCCAPCNTSRRRATSYPERAPVEFILRESI